MQQFAIVDQDDAESVLQYKWFINDKGAPSANRKGKYVTLGAFLSAGKIARGDKIEYINGNRLDNRRCNLQVLTKDHDKKGKKTENRGVRKVYTRAGVRWVVYVPIDGVYTASGSFEKMEEAIETHDRKLREQLGDQAPVLEIKQWARLVRVPLGTRQESDEAQKSAKAEKAAKKTKKGAKEGYVKVNLVDPRVWREATGWNPGEEPEGVVICDRGGVITDEEMSRMGVLHRDYQSEEYERAMVRWWDATRPESLLPGKSITA